MATRQTIADSPRQMPKLLSYGRGSRLKLEGTEPYSLYGDEAQKSRMQRQAGVGCQQSCDDKEVLRPVCNGHNLGHALHGPSGDKDMLQYLYDQGTLESVRKEEVVFESSSP